MRKLEMMRFARTAFHVVGIFLIVNNLPRCCFHCFKQLWLKTSVLN